MSLVATEPQPALAWSFESSNVDYITGLSPNLSTAGTYAAPSGGTITTVGSNRIHTFTTVGTDSITFLVPVTIQLLVVAGGGGGGGNAANSLAGGGGGAGEYYYNATYSVTPGTYSIAVGAGGIAGIAVGADGGDGGASVFGPLSANGGGGGSTGGAGTDGRPGGSGGGAGRTTGGQLGGATIKTAAGFGNNGGDNTAGANFSAAGGGGAAGAGTAASATGSAVVPGGAGRTNGISGGSVTYAAGGDGGARNSAVLPVVGTNGLGEGGGGGSANNTFTGVNGAQGGSGVVVIAYTSALYPAPTYVSGKYQRAINFDNQTAGAGANSYVTYTLTSDTSNSYSLSCWINPLHAIPPTINPNYVVLRDTGGYYSLQTLASSSASGFWANEGTGIGITQSGLLTVGKWDHHCFVLSNVDATSSNTIVTYYFNGTTQASGNVQRTNGFSTFSALDLGYRSGSGNSGAWCSIDDLRVYNTALTAAQVQSVYNQQGVPGRFVFSLPSTPSSSMAGAPLFSQLSAAAASSAVGAFSLRAVNGVTAKAVQIKRSSDSATQDFWADSQGNLLTAPVTGQLLQNWLGSASGNVVTWYDQTGLGNHATQATAANQPTINLSNVTVSFNGNQWVSNATPTGMFIPLYQNTYSIVTKHRQWTAGGAWGTGNTASFANGTFNGLRWSTGSNYQNFIGGGFLTFGPQPGTYPVVATVVNNRTTDIGYINGTQSSTGVVNPTIDPVYSQFIGQAPNGGNMIGELNALFFFKSAISTADRTIVESLI